MATSWRPARCGGRHDLAWPYHGLSCRAGDAPSEPGVRPPGGPALAATTAVRSEPTESAQGLDSLEALSLRPLPSRPQEPSRFLYAIGRGRPFRRRTQSRGPAPPRTRIFSRRRRRRFPLQGDGPRWPRATGQTRREWCVRMVGALAAHVFAFPPWHGGAALPLARGPPRVGVPRPRVSEDRPAVGTPGHTDRYPASRQSRAALTRSLVTCQCVRL